MALSFTGGRKYLVITTEMGYSDSDSGFGGIFVGYCFNCFEGWSSDAVALSLICARRRFL